MKNAWKKIFFLDFEKELRISFLKILLLINPIWTLLVSVILKDSILFHWKLGLYGATVVTLLGMGLIRLYLWVERVWAKGSSRTPPAHSLGWYLFLLGFAAPLGLYLSFHLWVFYINLSTQGEPMVVQFPWKYYGREIFGGWALLLICFIFISWQDLRDAARMSQLKAEELEKERLQALLTKLKDQMNPHFLFNTLNTVASLIPADPSKAEKVVVKLSAIYQGVLEATRKAEHSLEKELQFCRDYLDIEKVRFGQRLAAKVETEDGLNTGRVMVPVFILQPLVENAIKHGISSRASGGRLWIKAAVKNGFLVVGVEDDGVGFGNSPYAGTGTALENCRKRLELGFGKEGRLEILPREGGGTRVLLTLPVVTGETAVQEAT
jgi:two-component sensor histidine kinase